MKTTTTLLALLALTAGCRIDTGNHPAPSTNFTLSIMATPMWLDDAHTKVVWKASIVATEPLKEYSTAWGRTHIEAFDNLANGRTNYPADLKP